MLKMAGIAQERPKSLIFIMVPFRKGIAGRVDRI